MSVRAVLFAAALIMLVPAQVGADDAVPVLVHNPFNQPGLILQHGVETTNGALPEWSGVLHAVLVSGSNSLANIEGDLLAIGDLYQGFRLIGVEEDAAIFSKGGQRFVVRMASESDEDDNR